MSYWTYVNGNLYRSNNLTSFGNEDYIKKEIKFRKNRRKEYLKKFYKYIDNLKDTLELGIDRNLIFYISTRFIDKINGRKYSYDDNINISIQAVLRYEENSDQRINKIIKDFLSRFKSFSSEAVFEVRDAFGREFITLDQVKHDKFLFVFNNDDNLDILKEIIPGSNYKNGTIEIENKKWDSELIFENPTEFENILKKYNIKYIIKNTRKRM